MPFIIIPRSPRRDQLVKSVDFSDFDKALGFFQSLGNRSFIYDTNSTARQTYHYFKLLNDEVHDSINGLYYLSKTTIEEYGGFSSVYRVDFDKPDDAMMFKLTWI